MERTSGIDGVQSLEFRDGVLTIVTAGGVITTTRTAVLSATATAHIQEGRYGFPYRENDIVTGYVFTAQVYVTAPEGQEMWRLETHEAIAERKTDGSSK